MLKKKKKNNLNKLTSKIDGSNNASSAGRVIILINYALITIKLKRSQNESLKQFSHANVIIQTQKYAYERIYSQSERSMFALQMTSIHRVRT